VRRYGQLRAALAVLGVLASQMAVGEIQYHTKLPWWLVLTHVTLAAALWAATVAFVALLWRPGRIA
jgi:heme A synthase